MEKRKKVKQHLSDLFQEKWYQELRQELSKLVESVRYSAEERVKYKHLIGLKICEAFEKIPKGSRFKDGGRQNFVKKLSVDIRYTDGELRRCISFARRFPNFETFLKVYRSHVIGIL